MERKSMSAQNVQSYLCDLIDLKAILDFTLERNHSVAYFAQKVLLWRNI
jgi:hypothetical protein